MIVRFDAKALQQNVDKKAEPIGVEGDPATKKKGGVSEVDKIVSEAKRKSGIGGSGDGAVDMSSPERDAVKEEIITEEEEQEPGPELTPEGAKDLPAAKAAADAAKGKVG